MKNICNIGNINVSEIYKEFIHCENRKKIWVGQMQNRNYKGLLYVLKDAQLISKKKGKCKLIDIFFPIRLAKV